MRLAALQQLARDQTADQTASPSVTPGAPPWIWLWIALFAVSVPGVLDQRQAFADLRARVRQMNTSGELDWWDFALQAQAWIYVLLPAMLLFGLATVFLPWARSWFAHRRYGLGPLPKESKRLGPVVTEIEAFVHAHAPDLIIVGNPALLKVDPFVFPLDFHRSALAVTGKLLLQWSQNKDVAKAILLHEIGHYRRGDGRVVGVGSFFEVVVRYVAPGTILLLLVPTILTFAQELRVLSLGSETRRVAAETRWMEALQVVGTLAGRSLFASAAFAFGFLYFMVAPLAAIWSAEFTADRFAADSQGAAAHVQTVIASEKRVSWWTWLLSRLSHPPAKLRVWMLQRRLPTALLWLAIVFPLAYLLPRMFSLHGATAITFAILGDSLAEIFSDLVEFTLFYLQNMPLTWLAMAALLFVWPLVVRGWERIMTGGPGSNSRRTLSIYWLCATVLVLLALVGIMLAGMEPDGPKTL